ncbi:hypothetical protein QUB19_25180 [Microcoleus sp. B4-C5]|uniref:hypothetical protein n=1 Tax=unclassified Microcoleus TaxID=2642155 RepID=UPI002FD6CEB5
MNNSCRAIPDGIAALHALCDKLGRKGDRNAGIQHEKGEIPFGYLGEKDDRTFGQ